MATVKKLEYMHRWHIAHREQVLERQRLWRAANSLRIKELARHQKRDPEKVREYNAAYYAKNTEKIRKQAHDWATANVERKRDTDRRWRAAHPENVRAAARKWAKAHPDKLRERGARERKANPDRMRAAVRKWAAAHREEARAATRRWQKAHPELGVLYANRRRVRKANAGGTHTTEQWIALCWASSWRCFYCAAPLGPKTAVREHKKPLSRGGSDDISNIAVSCRSCNSQKAAKTEAEFRAVRGK